MNKLICSFFGAMLICFAVADAAEARRGGVSYRSGLFVTHIADLTKLDHAKLKGINLGWRHERFSIMGVPFWGTTAGSYVFYKEAGDGWRMTPAPPKAIFELSSLLNIPMGEKSPVSMFGLTRGGVIVLGFVLLAVFGKRKPKQPKQNIHMNEAQIDALLQKYQDSTKQAEAKPATAVGAQKNQSFGKRAA